MSKKTYTKIMVEKKLQDLKDSIEFLEKSQIDEIKMFKEILNGMKEHLEKELENWSDDEESVQENKTNFIH